MDLKIQGITHYATLKDSKLGCVVRMVVDSILPHAESGPNDHRNDAPPFISFLGFNKIRTKRFCQNLKYPYQSKSIYYILWVALKRADYDKT